MKNKDIVWRDVGEFKSFELKDVNFTYAVTEDNVLNDILILIKAGESIGIIGSTGSGKTTLINIMLGLLTPVKGKIYINKLPVESSLEILRDNTAYLLQNILSNR
jgi:ABC-type bacteriocin/lantibiotic exporter with double-glycine peptidase domain